MSVTQAAKPPPLPPRKGNLPPLPPGRHPSDPGTNNFSLPPPPPPRRNSSLATSDVDEFESRFRFHPLSSLPPPEPFSDGRRSYPSEMPRSVQRPAERNQLPSPPDQPPPLPPPR